MSPRDVPADELRTLAHERSELTLDGEAAVRTWWSPQAQALVAPELPASGAAFRDVVRLRASAGATARTSLLAGCGQVEVVDRLAPAEPVGRGAPGVALVRLVRGLDTPLDVAHRTCLGRPGALRWTILNRLAFGYLDGCKITVDGGEIAVRGGALETRLRAEPGQWSALTVAVDGHLPAEAHALRCDG